MYKYLERREMKKRENERKEERGGTLSFLFISPDETFIYFHCRVDEFC